MSLFQLLCLLITYSTSIHNLTSACIDYNSLLQVKSNRPAYPTIEEVEDKLRLELNVEGADPFDESLEGELPDRAGSTPLFLNHAAMIFFLLECKTEKDKLCQLNYLVGVILY